MFEYEYENVASSQAAPASRRISELLRFHEMTVKSDFGAPRRPPEELEVVAEDGEVSLLKINIYQNLHFASNNL